MRLSRITLAFFALLAPLPALAQSGPCQRGNSHISIGGVDLDELKCRLAVAEEALARQTSQAVAAEARRLLLTSELSAAQGEAARLRAEIDKLKQAPAARAEKAPAQKQPAPRPAETKGSP